MRPFAIGQTVRPIRAVLLLLLIVVAASAAFYFGRSRRPNAFATTVRGSPLTDPAKTTGVLAPTGSRLEYLVRYLGEPTLQILKSPDRIEAFRVEDKPFMLDSTGQPSRPPTEKEIEGYPLIRAGNEQGKEFATDLYEALIGFEAGGYSKCVFSPGVAFRVWKGSEHVTLLVCFRCAELVIVARDEQNRTTHHTLVGIGSISDRLLGLAHRAFPNDRELPP